MKAYGAHSHICAHVFDRQKVIIINQKGDNKSEKGVKIVEKYATIIESTANKSIHNKRPIYCGLI